MATEANLNWKPSGKVGVQYGFVGDQTNKAFSLTESAGKFVLGCEITGEENKGGTFDTEAKAKTHADYLINSYEVPKYGTETVELEKNKANTSLLSSNAK